MEKTILSKINKVNLYGANFKSLQDRASYGLDCLIFSIQRYADIKLVLTTQEWDYLIQNSNLLNTDHDGMDALMWAALCNSPSQQDINFTVDQWRCLIKGSNLGRAVDDWSALMYILYYHGMYASKLGKSNFDYLIENSDLLQKSSEHSTSVLGLIFKYKPDLINKVFTKVISSPKFNINNYKNDEYYKEIKNKIIEIETKMIKDNINKSILAINNKKEFKL